MKVIEPLSSRNTGEGTSVSSPYSVDGSVEAMFEGYSQEQLMSDFNQLNIVDEHFRFHDRNTDLTLEEVKQHFSSAMVPEVSQSFEEYAYTLSTQLKDSFVDVTAPRFIGHMTSKLPNFHLPMSLLVNLLNQNMVKLETSGAITLLERQLTAMLHGLFYGQSEAQAGDIQSSENVFGLVNSGGSIANVLCLQLAKVKSLVALNVDVETIKCRGANSVLLEQGFQNAAVICSSSAHYSFSKAAALMGWGSDNILTFDARQSPEKQKSQLEDILSTCEHNKTRVIALIGVAGATETGHVDNLPLLAGIARNRNLHFHVDAAWGGVLQFSEEYRHLLKGIEEADTITFCPHKQLYLPQGISVNLFKNPGDASLISVNAAYQARKGSLDFGQYTIEGSRPALCLHLHAALHVLGKQGIAELVNRNMSLTRKFRNLLTEEDGFELCWEPEMNIVNYRYIPAHLREANSHSESEKTEELNRLTQFISQRQFTSGKGFVSVTSKFDSLQGIATHFFRAVICNPLTTSSDLVAVLKEQRAFAKAFYEQVQNAKPLQAQPCLSD